jgi:hypothetical protein
MPANFPLFVALVNGTPAITMAPVEIGRVEFTVRDILRKADR